MSSLQVLMPVFNASETLAETLDSLLVQTHQIFACSLPMMRPLMTASR